MVSQHFLITGANRGIGASIARGLALRGHHLTLLCRDPNAARAFMQTLPKGAPAELLQADLSSRSAIHKAVLAIRDLPALNGLVHNAAIWPQHKQINCDGLELAFVVNHLAPFMMNLALEDRFKAAGTRVLQITAGLYPLGDRNFTATAQGENFSALRTYASTKLLNLATTVRFSERWQDSSAGINAVHPGVVRTDLGAMSGLKGAVLKLIKKFWLTPDQGSEAPIYLCTDPALQQQSGRFYDRFQKAQLALFMQDRKYLDAVWDQALGYANHIG